MNASRLPKSAPVAEPPALEAVPGPVAHERVERHWLGMPLRFFLLCLACAGLGASVGLFATGNWGWGLVALVAAVLAFAGFGEALRQGRTIWSEESARRAADGRSRAVSVAEVWRTRLETALNRWRTRTRLDDVEAARGPALRALGEAVWQADAGAEHVARQRLDGLEQERRRLEAQLAEQAAGAEERIRRARLPVRETIMVTPNEPNAPYPPPGEGDPPQPARVPEPYPPPDEGTPPTPAPDPGQADE